MVTYEYKCEANGETVSVRHSMTEKLATWGELCERTGRELGGTPADAPITRLIGGGNLLLKGQAAPPPPPKGPCGGGCACH